MESELQAAVGRVIAGRYKLIELIGNGSMGVVWRAEHLTLGAPVALKLIHMKDGGQKLTDELQRRFLREARAAAAVRSPHVAQILDHGVDDGLPYIALELLQGESLDVRLERDKRLSLEETKRYITHVARALSRAREAGYIHRDLKPSNVFLVANDGETIAKVLDFGLAKALISDSGAEDSMLTEIGQVVGTPSYMSPEQIRGKALDHRTDLWSLAMIAYECVCGGLPFQGETVQDVMIAACTEEPLLPSSFDHVLAPQFDDWFKRCAQRDPDRRFQSAKELATALAQVECAEAADLPIVAVPRSSRLSSPALESTALEDAETLIGPAPRVSLPEVSSGIYASTINLEELTDFWVGASHAPKHDAAKLSFKLNDRVTLKEGEREVGPIMMLEVLQAVRDGHLSAAVQARAVGSGAWYPLDALRVVGEDGRALDIAELVHTGATAQPSKRPLDRVPASWKPASESRYRWALFAALIAALLVIVVVRIFAP